MDAKELVGSWAAESGDSNIEFKADGTYIRVSSFAMPMTRTRGAVVRTDPCTRQAIRAGPSVLGPCAGWCPIQTTSVCFVRDASDVASLGT
jgi:hypothetical protein